MDWKQVLDAADEDYLVGISNKGIVKRAYKDREECGESPVIDFTQAVSGLAVTAGGEAVKICFPLGESKCSCPSRSICRHVVLAILYAKEQVQRVNASDTGKQSDESTSDEDIEKENVQEEDASQNVSGMEALWEEIYAYPQKKLLRTLGVKGLAGLVDHMERQMVPEIQQTSIITVKLPEEKYVVKLLYPLEYATCTCHKKELCAHKAEAILWCQWQAQKISVKDLKEQLEQAPEFDRELVQDVAKQIKNYIEELLQMGLCRSSVEVVNALERLAILAHNGELPRVENSLRSLAEDYHKYSKRSAGFSVTDTKHRLMQLYKIASQLSYATNNSDISKYAGEFHAEYKPVGNLDLVGITLEHFVSKSGYEGDTVYFLEEHTGKWYTYTNARPTFYDNKRRSAYTEKATAPWGLSTISLGDLANMQIHLKNAKADETGRLSSTQDTQGEVIQMRKLTEELLEKWYYKDFGDAFQEQIEVNYGEDIGEMRNAQNLVFLHPHRREASVFDQVKQILRIPLYDEQGRKVLVEVAYSAKEKNTIHYLEHLKDNAATCFLGRLYLQGDTLRLYPLDLFSKKDLPWSKDEKEIWSLFSRKETKVKEIKIDTSAQDKIVSLFAEMEALLGDLYQVGFGAVQESVLQRMQELMELTKLYGLKNLAQQLELLQSSLSKQRHQVRHSEEASQEILENYRLLCDYITTGQKKVMYDKAKICYYRK